MLFHYSVSVPMVLCLQPLITNSYSKKVYLINLFLNLLRVTGVSLCTLCRIIQFLQKLQVFFMENHDNLRPQTREHVTGKQKAGKTLPRTRK